MARVFFIVEPFNNSVGFIGETVDELESNVQLGKVVNMKEALPKDLYVNAISYQIKGIGTLKIAIDAAYPEGDESKIAEDRSRMAESTLRDFLRSNVMKMSQRELQEKVVEKEFQIIEQILKVNTLMPSATFGADGVFIMVSSEKFALFNEFVNVNQTQTECGRTYDEEDIWIETKGECDDVEFTLIIFIDAFGNVTKRRIIFNNIVYVQEKQDSSNKIMDRLRDVVSNSKINDKISHKMEKFTQKFTKLMFTPRDS